MTTEATPTKKMKKSSKFAIGIASVVLAGGLLAGTASAAGTGTGAGLGKDLGAKICANQDKIDARIANIRERIADRRATLLERRAAAIKAGDTKAVEMIDKHLGRLDRITARVDVRVSRYHHYVANHCDGSATGSSPTSTPDPTPTTVAG